MQLQFLALPRISDKVVLGTNSFTETKSMAFLKYHHQIKYDYEKKQRKKSEEAKLLKFDLFPRVSLVDKQNFTSKTTNAKSKLFDEFKEQMTSDDIEFEKKIEYDEKVYEENMREKRNLVENLQNFDENPKLLSILSQYKYEFYKKKGFKTNNFNLAADNDEFSLEEFSVLKQMTQKGEADHVRKKLTLNSTKFDRDSDGYEKYQRKLTERFDKMKRSEKGSPSFVEGFNSQGKKKSRKKLTKQISNKNFMFWLDLNKSQRILLKMKNFLGKLIRLKIPILEVF